MPSSNPPSSPLREASVPQRSAAVLASTQPDHPPSHRAAAAPFTAAKPPGPWRQVLAALNRLRASFARAEAVHQARMDGAFKGPERHLLVRYTCSAK